MNISWTTARHVVFLLMAAVSAGALFSSQLYAQDSSAGGDVIFQDNMALPARTQTVVHGCSRLSMYSM
jgi:hypothetical protein